MRISGFLLILLLGAMMLVPAVSAEHLKVTSPVAIAKLMHRSLEPNETLFVKISPIGIHPPGEHFSIIARTNLPVNAEINYMIYSTSYVSQKSLYSTPPGQSGTVRVLAGEGYTNKISIDVNSSGFRVGEYAAQIQMISNDGIPFDILYFNVLPSLK
jgi:hypothetical protein